VAVQVKSKQDESIYQSNDSVVTYLFKLILDIIKKWYTYSKSSYDESHQSDNALAEISNNTSLVH